MSLEIKNEYLLGLLDVWQGWFNESDPRHKMVAKWSNELKEFDSRPLKLVSEAISEGYDTLTEITAETGLDRQIVVQIIKQLLREKKICEAHVCPVQNERVYDLVKEN